MTAYCIYCKYVRSSNESTYTNNQYDVTIYLLVRTYEHGLTSMMREAEKEIWREPRVRTYEYTVVVIWVATGNY